MLDIVGIFKNRVLNVPHLLAFGFAGTTDGYGISYPILNGQFQMMVTIDAAGAVSIRVLDADSREDYVLIHAPTASGAFVGSVINACEEKLNMIAERCFDIAVFRSEQAKQVIAYAEQAHQDHLEFLWEKFAGNAVFRRRDTEKWYAALLTVARAKLGLAEDGVVEILDLRGLPEEIEHLIDGKNYFPGYHMNKKHWYTICLDDSVPTRELCERIETSYSLAKK